MKKPYWVSPLGLFNMLFLQWFFIRLAAVGEMVNNQFVRTSWTTVRWVVPMTGWWSKYVYVNRRCKPGTARS